MLNRLAQYEDASRDCARDGMPGLKQDSYRYIEFPTSTDDDQAARPGTLRPKQRESFLQVIYADAILRKPQIAADGLLNIVTGAGKTAVIEPLGMPA